MSTGGGSRPRVIALDGLRGVAIWLVMLVHFTRDQAQVALAIGVDVFFVLSGYLITSLVVAELRRDSFAVRTFMRRRLERIYPALLVLVVAFGLTGVGLFGSSPKRVLAEVFAALTFTYPLLLPTEIDGVLQLLPLWSLSVEVWFYFIWPPVLRRWTRRDRSDARLRRIAAWLVAGVVSVQVVRALTYAGPAVILHRLRIDLLAIGAVFALISTSGGLRDRATRYVHVMSALALPLVFISSVLSRPYPYWVDAGVTVLPEAIARFFGPWGGPGFNLAMWCTGALVYSMMRHEGGRETTVLSWKPLVFFGVISYSVYLWHYPISHLIYVYGPSWLQWDAEPLDYVAASAYVLICVIVSTVVGWLSYRFVEQRWTRRVQLAWQRKRLSKDRS